MKDLEAIAASIGESLRRSRSDLTQEKLLHKSVENGLSACGVAYEREFRLGSADRPDFYLPDSSTVIEVKKRNAGAQELRQIARYLEHSNVSAAVLIALRINGFPLELFGKPILKIELWRYLL
jgi:hypothetical protein